MAKVGNITYITVHDELEFADLPTKQSERVTRPNVDGTALRLLGTQGTPFRKIAERDVLDSAQAQFILDVGAQVGTIVSMIDDLGDTRTDLFVMNTRIVSRTEAPVRAGGLTDPSLPAQFFRVEYTLIDGRAAP